MIINTDLIYPIGAIYLSVSATNPEILFGGNGDLYWIIRSKIEANNHSFIITKENYEVYELFNKLFL